MRVKRRCTLESNTERRLFVCERVYVCVCVRERERERERVYISVTIAHIHKHTHAHRHVASHITAYAT